MSLAAHDFDYVATLVRSEAAIMLEPTKGYLVQSRLAPVARRRGVGSVAELLALLRRNGDHTLRGEVVEAMTTNETSFFRDIHPFTTLAEHVLPDLMRRRAGCRALTVWCGACSTGQEPYSVAMLIRDRVPALADWNVRIIASDISTEVLERAAAGRYTQMEVGRGMPARLLAKYFQRQGAGWRIADDIRRMVEFRTHNLVRAWTFLPSVDVVLLRNVLIYFDLATKQRILARVRQTMQPDGYLFLGGPETTLNIDDGFARVPLGGTTVYQPR